MARFRLDLEYAGTRYRGWQVQKNARSVAGELMRAVREVAGREAGELYGSGRTDAGVHALHQVAHLDLETRLEPEALARGLNDALPPDVNVLAASRVGHRFHARHAAVARSYLYQVSRRRTAFAKPYVWWVRDRLDVARLERAASRLEGLHDFGSFVAAEPGAGSTRVRLERAQVAEAGELVLIRLRASHFLWKMVRRLVGVLVEIGRGGLDEAEIGRLLREASETPAELTAPPSGLFLERVFYEGEERELPLVPAFQVPRAPKTPGASAPTPHPPRRRG